MRIGVFLVLLGIVVSTIAEADPEPGIGWKKSYFRRYGKYKGKGYPRRRVYVLRSYPYTYAGYGYGSGHYGTSGQLYGGHHGYQPIHTGFQGHYGYSGYGGYGGYKGLHGGHLKGFGGIKAGFGDSLELGGLHGGLKGGISGSFEKKGFGSGYGKGFIGGGKLFKGGFGGQSSSSEENKGFISSYSSIGLHKAHGSGGTGFGDSDERKGFRSGFIWKGANGSNEHEGSTSSYTGKTPESESSNENQGSREGKKKESSESKLSKDNQGSREGEKNKSRESKSSKENQGSREGKKKESRESKSNNEKQGSREGEKNKSRESKLGNENQGSREEKKKESREEKKKESRESKSSKDNEGSREGEKNKSRESKSRKEKQGSREGKKKESRESKSNNENQGSREGEKKESREFTGSSESKKSKAESEDSIEQNIQESSGENKGQEPKSVERTLFRSEFLKSRGDGKDSNEKGKRKDEFTSAERKDTRSQKGKDSGSGENMKSRDQRRGSEEDGNSRSKSSSEEGNGSSEQTGRDYGSRENDKSRVLRRKSREDRNSNTRSSSEESTSFRYQSGRDSGSKQNEKSRDQHHKSGEARNSKSRSEEKHRFSGRTHGRNDESFDGERVSNERKDGVANSREQKQSGRKFQNSGDLSGTKSRSKEIEKSETEKSDSSKSKESKGSLLGGSIISIIKNFFAPKGSVGTPKSSPLSNSREGKRRSSEDERFVADSRPRGETSVGSLRNFEARHAASAERGSFKVIAEESDDRRKHRKGFTSRDGSKGASDRSRESDERKRPVGRIADSAWIIKNTAGVGISGEHVRSIGSVSLRTDQNEGRRGFQGSYERDHFRGKSSENGEIKGFHRILNKIDERKRSWERIADTLGLKNIGRGFVKSERRKNSRDRNDDSLESKNIGRGSVKRIELKSSRERIVDSHELKKIGRGGGRSDERERPEDGVAHRSNPWRGRSGFEDSGERQRPTEFNSAREEAQRFQGRLHDSGERTKSRGHISESSELKQDGREFSESEQRLLTRGGFPARFGPNGGRREPDYSDELVKSRPDFTESDHPRGSSRRKEESGKREHFTVGFSKSAEISGGFGDSDEKKRFNGGRREPDHSDELVKSRSPFLGSDHPSGSSRKFEESGKREHFTVGFSESAETSDGFGASDGRKLFKGDRRKPDYSDELVKSRSPFLGSDHPSGSSRRFEESSKREQFPVGFSKRAEISDGFGASDEKKRFKGGRTGPDYSDELVKSRSPFLGSDHPSGSSRRFEESGKREHFTVGFSKSAEISDGFGASDEKKRFKGGRTELDYSDELVKSRSPFSGSDHPSGSSKRFEESGKREHFTVGFSTSAEIRDGFGASDERKLFKGDRRKPNYSDELVKFRSSFLESDHPSGSSRRFEESGKREHFTVGVSKSAGISDVFGESVEKKRFKGGRTEPDYSDELVRSRSPFLGSDHPSGSSRRFEESGKREHFTVGSSKSAEISDGFGTSDGNKRFKGDRREPDYSDELVKSRSAFLASDHKRGSIRRLEESGKREHFTDGFSKSAEISDGFGTSDGNKRFKGDRREPDYSDELVKSRSAFLESDHPRGSSRRFEESGKRQQFTVGFPNSAESRDGFEPSDERKRLKGRSKGTNGDESIQKYAVSDEHVNFGGSSRESDEQGVFRGKLIRSGEHLEFVGKLALNDGKIGIGLGSFQAPEKEVSGGFVESADGKTGRKSFRKGIVKEVDSSRSLENGDLKRPVAYILGSIEDDRVLGDYVLNTEYSVITKKFADINERDKFITDVLKSVEYRDDDEVNDSRGSLRDSKENHEKKIFAIKNKSSEEVRNIHTVKSHDIRDRGHSNSAQFKIRTDDHSVESVRSRKGFRRIIGDGVEIRRSFPTMLSGVGHSSEKGTASFGRKGPGLSRDHESSY